MGKCNFLVLVLLFSSFSLYSRVSEFDSLHYNHAYHQSLVYKFTISTRGNPEEVTTLDEVLSHIRKMYNITGGLKQIIYLYDGGAGAYYPHWTVNPYLKRPEDKDARASYIRLAKEARKYNAFISVHLNMSDVYEASPLWKEYLAHGLIECNQDGTPRKKAIWMGQQSYNINKEREWETGYAQKRIDAVLEYLPFIRENGTVHIDAFGMIGGNDKLRKTVFSILDYWRQNGVDVTTEYMDIETIGRVPMVWHLNFSEENRLKYPPDIICGGGDFGNQRITKSLKNWESLPDAGCLYDEAWGVSIDRSGTNRKESLDSRMNILGKFCTKTLVWYYLNRYRALSYQNGNDLYRVSFSDGIGSTVRKADRHLTIRCGNRTLVDGGNIFIPALWTKGEWFAYSQNGGTYVWPLPAEWKGAELVNTVALTDEGRGEKSSLPVQNGMLSITLKAGTGMAISR